MATKKYKKDTTNKNNKGFDDKCNSNSTGVVIQCPTNLQNVDTVSSTDTTSSNNSNLSKISKTYRNRLVINQRGASITINNTSDNEGIQISQRSGSNFNINNLVNSELATNNKQTLVANDKFETIKGDCSEYIGGDYNKRIGGTSYIFKGFKDETELRAYDEWKDAFAVIAAGNAKFKIKRGGISIPNGQTIPLEGKRADNPVIGSETYTVESIFSGYDKIPTVGFLNNDVNSYSSVSRRIGQMPSAKKITLNDISKSAGANGSAAPGVMEFGAQVSAATENGEWATDTDTLKIDDYVKEMQPILTEIESKMGDGGDEHVILKRNKLETIGAIFNDYPSVKIDEKGRSQPFEMLVSDTGAYKNHDYIPLLEEIDNSSNFPCGKDVKIVGNSYVRNVGSGGISLKTSGSMEMGGTIMRVGFKQLMMNASHGIHIGSEAGVEIQSLKTITLRTDRQVYVESSLGVKNNLIVGGGLSVEGETYLQHVTAPLEVQQTEDTIIFSKFNTLVPRTLLIGECIIPSGSSAGIWPVFALPTPDIIESPPHGHHFNNLPLNLTKSNSGVRKEAQNNGINRHNSVAIAYPQVHEKKYPRGS